MGGQTALNLCIEADEKGIWKDFDIEIIGVDIDAINITEDREKFRELMLKIGVGMAPQATATSFLKGKEIAQEFGFPLVIRASYTLGGAGASIVYKPEDFDELLSRGLEISPIHEVMIDKALMGWRKRWKAYCLFRRCSNIKNSWFCKKNGFCRRISRNY